jgi:hypothetical protein
MARQATLAWTLLNARTFLQTFQSFRGGEAAFVFGTHACGDRVASARNRSLLEPYHSGHRNEEGIESGAWWFYYKLGFAHVTPGA